MFFKFNILLYFFFFKVSPDQLVDDDMRLEDGVMSPEDSDLAQLRSLNEGELSADWYNFQVRTKFQSFHQKNTINSI